MFQLFSLLGGFFVKVTDQQSAAKPSEERNLKSFTEAVTKPLNVTADNPHQHVCNAATSAWMKGPECFALLSHSTPAITAARQALRTPMLRKFTAHCMLRYATLT